MTELAIAVKYLFWLVLILYFAIFNNYLNSKFMRIGELRKNGTGDKVFKATIALLVLKVFFAYSVKPENPYQLHEREFLGFEFARKNGPEDCYTEYEDEFKKDVRYWKGCLRYEVEDSKIHSIFN